MHEYSNPSLTGPRMRVELFLIRLASARVGDAMGGKRCTTTLERYLQHRIDIKAEDLCINPPEDVS